jgi:PRTRC genetic system protein C
MALVSNKLERKFSYKGKDLQDIPGATLKEVAKAYSGIYPELLNSMPTYKDIVDGVEIYEFAEAQVGLKG